MKIAVSSALFLLLFWLMTGCGTPVTTSSYASGSSASSALSESSEASGSSYLDSSSDGDVSVSDASSQTEYSSQNESSQPVGKVNKNVRGLPVLMYHNFYDASAGGTGKDSNWMEISDFDKHMKYLSDNQYYFPTWDEVRRFVDGTLSLPEKSVVITMDDGRQNIFDLAVPVLKKYNIKATAFVITSKIKASTVEKYRSETLEFQSHSHDMHRAGTDGKGRFLTLSHESAFQDLTQSKDFLGGAKEAFCYPYGHFSDLTKKVLKDADFKLAFTTQPGRVYPGMDPYSLPRVRMSKGDGLNAFTNRVK